MGNASDRADDILLNHHFPFTAFRVCHQIACRTFDFPAAELSCPAACFINLRLSKYLYYQLICDILKKRTLEREFSQNKAPVFVQNRE